MKQALVTGGSSRVGAAIVQALADDGFHVWAHHHRSPVPVDDDAVTPVQADLSQASGRRALADAVGDELHVLVNNVGIYPEEYLEDITLERFEAVFSLTCTAVFDLVRLLRPALVAAAPSRVVNLGDSGADRIEARRQATPYHIAKLGVHVLTRTYAQMLTHEGVTVNMVSPGFLENSVGEPGEPIPAGRKGRMEDIVQAIRWLISDDAAYTSGTNLLVNGGWNLG